MAVAVKNTPDIATPTTPGSLATASLLGALYVFASLAILFAGVPWLWATGVQAWLLENLGSFVNAAGLIIVELFVFGLVVFVGLSLTGGTPRPGLKAGSFAVIAAILLAVWFASLFTGTGTFGEVFGVGIAVAGLVYGVMFLMSQKFEPRMIQFDNQGWLSASPYKASQGRIVRRFTMIGILGLAACGIWTLINHHTLETVGPNWVLALPFVGRVGTILPELTISVPILLSAAAFWLAYRAINFPTFAEFLIATEGELNKVAWPTRKSLWQDTVVVLATVALLTIFLFFADMAWGRILSNEYVGVLRLNSKKAAEKVVDVKDLDW